MDHATIPRNSSNFCNVTTSHTTPAALTTQDLMVLLREWLGVAKKLMDKAGSEGKPWISGLYEYGVTPQSGSIASPLQLITQCTPREKDLPQLPSTLGAQEVYETHQELIRKQQNKLEKNYIELTPGMAVWVQHRQNTIFGTSYSREPKQSQLILDHAREWH